MDLINGLYLDHEICAFSGSVKNMWVIVYDGKYNYMLFNTVVEAIVKEHNRRNMPYNGTGRTKQVEYYSNFDNALNNLIKVISNGHKFLTHSRELF